MLDCARIAVVPWRSASATARLLGSDQVEPVNVGNPREMTIREFAETILRLTGSSSRLSFHPLPEDDPKVRQPDISKARELIGWEPKVSLEDGLKKTIDEAGVEQLVGTGEHVGESGRLPPDLSHQVIRHCGLERLAPYNQRDPQPVAREVDYGLAG